MQGYFHPVGGRSDRPGGDRHPPDVQTRITVQCEDPRHPAQCPGGDRVDRTAGHQLLGGLKDQPHRDGQLRYRGQRQAGAQQDGGVRVMPAAVGNSGHRRGIRRAGALGHRQGVQIGAQRDPRPVFGTDITGQPGPTGQHLGFEPRIGQPLGDERGGGELLAAQFGMAVDMATPVDQIVVVGGQPGFDGVGDVGLAEGRTHNAALRSANSSTRSRWAGVCANRTTVRANMIAPSTTAVSPPGLTAAAANAG